MHQRVTCKHRCDRAWTEPAPTRTDVITTADDVQSEDTRDSTHAQGGERAECGSPSAAEGRFSRPASYPQRTCVGAAPHPAFELVMGGLTFAVPSSWRLMMSRSKSFLEPSVLLKAMRPVRPSHRACGKGTCH